jgi:hypothetical protein
MPGLVPASTSYFFSVAKDVVGRDKSAFTRVFDALCPVRGSAWRVLGENALQRPPMHAQPARRLGDVPLTQAVDAIDVLPAYPVR